MTRKKELWAISKPQILKLSDGLFLEEVENTVGKYPGLTLCKRHVDAFAADVYLHPERYDVAVATNMFGDILSDLTGALSGGLGLAGGLNAGEDHAAAKATHGSAPDIAGKGIANPTSMILSTAALLDWMATRHDKPAVDTGRSGKPHRRPRRQGHDQDLHRPDPGRSAENVIGRNHGVVSRLPLRKLPEGGSTPGLRGYAIRSAGILRSRCGYMRNSRGGALSGAIQSVI